MPYVRPSSAPSHLPRTGSRILGGVAVWWLLVALAMLCGPIFPAVASVTGAPFVEAFTYETYGVDGRNNQFAQDHDGVIIVADRSAVYEFDGAAFRALPLPDGVFAYPAVDDRDRIYLGGYGQFGYLTPKDASGRREYVSLVDQVPTESDDPILFFSPLFTTDDVWAHTPRMLLRFTRDDSLAAVIRVPDGGVFQARELGRDETLLIHVQHHGLHRVVDDSLQLLTGSEPLGGHYAIRNLHALEGDSVLAFSEDRGCWLYDGQRTRFQDSELSDLGKANGLMGAVWLDDSTSAIVTYRGGVIIATVNGRVLQRITKQHGLPANSSYSGILADREGGIWVSTTEGIARIEWNSPLRWWDERHGLSGVSFAVYPEPGGPLWVGTSIGLYRAEDGSRWNGTDPLFTPVEMIHGAAVAILPLNNGLYHATNVKLHRIDTKRNEALDTGPEPFVGSMAATTSPDGRRAYLCSFAEVHIREARGAELVRVDTVAYPKSVIPLACAMEGDSALWVLFNHNDMSGRGLFRLNVNTASPDLGQSVVFDSSRGLQSRPLNPQVIGDRVLVATVDGFLDFDARTGTLSPAVDLNRAIPEDFAYMRYVLADASGGVWLMNGDDRIMGMRQEANGWKPVVLPNFNRGGQIRSMMVERSGDAVWVGHSNGRLVRCDTRTLRTPSPVPVPLVRRVIIPRDVLASERDSLVYGPLSDPEFRAEGLDYASNSLRFEVALPMYDGFKKTRYRSRLVGLNNGWSAWTDETFRDFTGLSEGHYVFEVQARDVDGRLSPVGTYSFHVNPPWFRTAWAFVLWGLMLTGFIYGIILLREARSRRQRQQLEAIIAQRTEELRKAQEEETRLALEAERLSTKNKLAATIAHEFNNPLAVILGMTELMKKQQFDADTVDRLDRIRFQVRRMHTNVRELIELQELREMTYTTGSTIIDLHGVKKPENALSPLRASLRDRLKSQTSKPPSS